ncbi:MAG TPA: hypothetical protein VN461_10180, partial [Vicinamibacteria bacterium]|nr:hypothetical protein [Vicinamibacteria bacterium]
MASCPLCRQRKGKRRCPAKGAEICSHCCGTKRRIEIDCPDDCVYLRGPVAWAGRETERQRDLRRLAPHFQELSDEQSRLFFITLVGITAIHSRRTDLDDKLLIQAVTAFRKTVETRGRGILYDHQAEDLRAQGLVHDLRALFEARDEEGKATAPDDRDLQAVLQSLESALGESI